MNELIRRLIDQVARRRRRGDETVTDDRELDRRMREERELVFVGGVFFVEKFAYFVERTVVEERLEGGQLFVGFERFSILTGHAERRQRYLELEELDNQAWAYGWDEPLDYSREPPGPWPFRGVVPVQVSAEDPIRWSWFVVYRGLERSYCLVALSGVRGENGLGATGRPREVRFRGVWTTDEKIADAVAADLLRVVNPYYGK